MRQSNSVGMNFCAISRSDSSIHSVASAFSSSKFEHFLTPREKDESGIFSTSGKPSVSAASSKSAGPAIITVGGTGTLLAVISSFR